MNKTCVCNGAWKLIDLGNNNYHQDCLNSCPGGYIQEDISKECIVNANVNTDIPTEKISDIVIEIIKFENETFFQCPNGTCLTQEDPELKTCIKIRSNTKIFNDICFENLDEITKNIKSFSENEKTITTESGIIIHGYSTNSEDNKPSNKNVIIFLEVFAIIIVVLIIKFY